MQAPGRDRAAGRGGDTASPRCSLPLLALSVFLQSFLRAVLALCCRLFYLGAYLQMKPQLVRAAAGPCAGRSPPMDAERGFGSAWGHGERCDPTGSQSLLLCDFGLPGADLEAAAVAGCEMGTLLGDSLSCQ